jgi:hypothetical protein
VGGHSTPRGVLEPSCDEVLVRIGGHTNESVEAATDAIEVPGRYVVLQAAGAVAEGTRLRGCELTCPSSGKLEQRLQLVGRGGTLPGGRHVPNSIRCT